MSGATEEQIEAAAKALAQKEPGSEWDDFDEREFFLRRARQALEAAFSVSVSAHPADERHDAEERPYGAKDVVHFAPYGGTNAACDETVPRGALHRDAGSGVYSDPRFTDRRAETTCHECQWRANIHPSKPAPSSEREAEAEDHVATVQVGIHEPNHNRVYCVRFGGKWPCDGSLGAHAATVTGDREKLISDAAQMLDAWLRVKYDVNRNVPRIPFIHELADVLATPVEVDEAKLAEVLDDHSRYVMVQPGVNECGCGVPVGPVRAWNAHKARAVTKWLRGDGQ